MNSKEEEYKEIFLAEATENHEELNRLLTQLEKVADDKNALNAIFRITHTLKGNAAGMGFKEVSDFAHVMEDLFGELREGNIQLNKEIFASLFKAVDVLGELIQSVKTNEKVKYRGIKTKLQVMLKNARGNAEKEVSPSPQKQTQVNEEPVDDLQSTEIELLEDEDEPTTTKGPKDSQTEAQKDSKIGFSDLVQVPVRKLDDLLNLVGELVIERDRIITSQAGKVATNEYARLNRISSDLQYAVMDVRLVQVGFLFNKFHRVVRDAAILENKEVKLELKGTDTEIDRNVLQIISDSLIHLIRNAVGHGIEVPEARKKANKKAEGTITLAARSESDSVIIDIQDDGQGVNASKIKEKAVKKGLISAEDAALLSENDAALLIFEPGLSTMDEVTSIAGRGVGMDVVKRAIDSIGGNIAVHTEPGQGSVFSLTLPSSMAVKSTLLFELEQATYAIPLSHTQAVVSLYKKDIHKLNGGLIATHLDSTISVVFLSDLFNMVQTTGFSKERSLQDSFNNLHPEKKLEIVIVTYGNRKLGFVVDKLLQQKEIVEKPLVKPVDHVKLISGVTIMGNGHVCLVLNVAAICNLLFNRSYSNKQKLFPQT